MRRWDRGPWRISCRKVISRPRAIDQFRREFPELDVRFYQCDSTLHETLTRELRDADFVIIHEWTDPDIAGAICHTSRNLDFVRCFTIPITGAYTNAGEILRFPLHLFDGVLAFGDAIRRIYLDGFGVPQAWTFHEAADVSHFHPIEESRDFDLLWIGNWGDEERSRETDGIPGCASCKTPQL